MKRSKIGRNDPCPCGSGKKYKSCCLALESLTDQSLKPFDRYSQLISSLKLKLDQHYDLQIRKIRKPLQEKFMRLSITHYLPPEQEPVFSDWLWFDMVDSQGMSFGTEYMRDNGDFMEEPLRECLQALNSSYLSLYETVGMEDDFLQVKDYITGENHLIMLKEPLDMEAGEFQPLLLGRLAALPLGKVFSGMVLMLKNDEGQGDFINQHMKYLHQLRPDEEMINLLKYHTEILFGLFDHANQKATVFLKDIRVLRFEPGQSNPINEQTLSATCTLVHTTQGINWYDLKESFSQVRIGIHRDYMVFYANILADILRMEDWLQELLPQSQWEVVNSLFLLRPPAPEMDDIWYTVIREQETERWLHTVHSELNDKTPLQVLEEENGRERLQTMLDTFASKSLDNEYSKDLVNYMRERIM
ncbi:MAG: SEC-C metal-binding domain-containing protein [Syntrophomonas sp.]